MNGVHVARPATRATRPISTAPEKYSKVTRSRRKWRSSGGTSESWRLWRHSGTLIWSAARQLAGAYRPRLRVGFGGGSASAVVDVCVATHMRGLVPHDRVCEMRSGAGVSGVERYPSGLLTVFSRVAPRVVCAGALSPPKPFGGGG